MMKIYAVFLCTLLLVIASAGAVSAAPMYYTFEGEVSSNYGDISDEAGIIKEAGITYGTEVKYVFMVDFHMPGQYTKNDGSVFKYTDYINSSYYGDYFYVDFISGSLIEEKDGGLFNKPSNPTEYNFGYSYSNPARSVQGAGGVGESADEYTSVYSNANGPFSDWEIGDTVAGFERAYDSEGKLSYFYSSLELTSISATPAPEPTTMLLLGTGLVGLVGLRQKFKR